MQNSFNVRNQMVSKEKNSDFLDFLSKNPILKSCPIRRVFPSGNYFIYTFDIDVPEQREELKQVQDNWI